MGRYTRGRRLHDAMRGASAVLLRLGPAVHGGEAPRARSHQRSAVAEGEASRQSVRSAAAVQPAVSEACSPRRRTRRPMASDVKTTWPWVAAASVRVTRRSRRGRCSNHSQNHSRITLAADVQDLPISPQISPDLAADVQDRAQDHAQDRGGATRAFLPPPPAWDGRVHYSGHLAAGRGRASPARPPRQRARCRAAPRSARARRHSETPCTTAAQGRRQQTAHTRAPRATPSREAAGESTARR